VMLHCRYSSCRESSCSCPNANCFWQSMCNEHHLAALLTNGAVSQMHNA
jgi:hypothetical protein